MARLNSPEALKDYRVHSPEEEIALAYGQNIATVIKRVFKFERHLLLAAFSYICLSLLLIYALEGTNWISPTIAVALGVVSNVITSLLTFLATNLRSRK